MTKTKLAIFALMWVGIFTVLLLRLLQLQVFQGQSYVKKAEDNRFYTQRLPALRGVILDRFGDPLVWNIQKFFAVENPGALYEKLSPIGREQALQLMATNSASVNTKTERFYRFPQSLAPVLGYVGDATAQDLQKNAGVLVGQQLGKAGLELNYDKQLNGQDGKIIYEIDALGHKLREIDRVEPTAGHDLPTSLDPYLTEVAAQALAGKNGAVVVTDATNGQIIALTSLPSYDANLLTQTFADAQQEAARKMKVQAFFTDPQNLFFDRAISGSYPPGSIFKVVVGLAGLENNNLTAATQVDDQGILKVGDFQYGNWYYRQYGRVEGNISLVRALARSNDIYFYKAAEWTGPDAIASMGRLLGLGGKTGIDLPAETRGLMPDPIWKQKVKNERWFLGDTYHMGIGQGDILTSPIQLAQMTQALANQGSLCQVSVANQTTRQCHQAVTNLDHLKLILEGMLGVCTSGGTAYPFFPYNAKHLTPDVTDANQELANGAMACKTGTAEFGPADDRGYRKTHGWFTSMVTLPNFQTTFTSSLASASATVTASQETVTGQFQNEEQDTQQLLWQKWQQKVRAVGFPRNITITVLVESDQVNPYREGSIDGAPIAKKIIDWMEEGGKAFAASP